MSVEEANAEAKRRYGSSDHPFDWTYAGEHPMGAQHGVWVYSRGYVHAPTFEEAFRLADQQLAAPSAPRETYNCTRGCKWPDRLCDASCKVGARPSSGRVGVFAPDPEEAAITPAEREFLKELARRETLRGPNFGPLFAAARKVQGE